MWMLAAWYTTFLAVLFVLLSVVLILAILIQKPKGGGLSGAFGGAGGGQQAVFGSRVGDVLTWATVIIFALVLLLAISLVYLTRAEGRIDPGPGIGAPASTGAGETAPPDSGESQPPAEPDESTEPASTPAETDASSEPSQ